MIFPSETEVMKYMNDLSNVKEWAALSKQYILNSQQELITYPKQIFFIQHATFMPNKLNKKPGDEDPKFDPALSQRVDVLVSVKYF